MIYRNITVLVLAAQDSLRDDIRYPLETAGINVCLANWNGSFDGVQQAAANSPVVLVADLSEMANGQCQKLTDGVLASDLANTPLILLTDDNSPRKFADKILRRADYRLSKPFRHEDLVSIISAASADHLRAENLREEVRQRTSAIGQIVSGEFRIKTLDEARNLSTMLSLAYHEPDNVAVGILELVINGIEHGNLGIGFELKSKLLAGNQWTDEIERRLALPENAEKRVCVTFSKSNTEISVGIKDEGAGFDHSSFTSGNTGQKAGQLHGRGIFLASHACFDRLEYFDCGNRVIASNEIS